MAIPATLDDDFVVTTVRRSMPNPDRPRLKTESETKLVELEQRCAASYAAIETVTEDLRRLNESLSNDGNAVPQESWDGENSLVQNVDELKSLTKKP